MTAIVKFKRLVPITFEIFIPKKIIDLKKLHMHKTYNG